MTKWELGDVVFFVMFAIFLILIFSKSEDTFDKPIIQFVDRNHTERIIERLPCDVPCPQPTCVYPVAQMCVCPDCPELVSKTSSYSVHGAWKPNNITNGTGWWK